MPAVDQRRTSVPVAGASDVLAALRAAPTPSEAARRLRALGPSLDLDRARQATSSEGRAVVIADDRASAVLGVRWFVPGAPTTIHEHGCWGAVLVVAGRDRYERFEHREAGAALDATFWLEPGDVVWWRDPPDDLHRQEAMDGGALELILLAGPPSGGERTYESVDDLGPAAPLVAAVRGAYTGRSSAPLREHYDEGVVADICVPSWRFQIGGRDALQQLLDGAELGLADQRLQSFRAFPLVGGCVVEVAVRFRHGTETRLWRAVHVLRCRQGKVVEHLVHCTGHWDADTIARHAREADLLRP